MKNAAHKQNVKVSCLKLSIEMNGFCLKQGQGLKASAAHSQTSLKCPLPPGAKFITRYLEYIIFFNTWRVLTSLTRSRSLSAVIKFCHTNVFPSHTGDLKLVRSALAEHELFPCLPRINDCTAGYLCCGCKKS